MVVRVAVTAAAGDKATLGAPAMSIPDALTRTPALEAGREAVEDRVNLTGLVGE